MILTRQLRAARADLNLTLDDVSEATNIAKTTISDIENEKTEKPRGSTLETLKIFYESQGIEFLESGSISPRDVKVDRYSGEDGFRYFMNDVYEVARKVGGEIRLHNAKPENWRKWLGQEWLDMHCARMDEIADTLNFKITAGHGDKSLLARHAEYRWLPKEMWNQQSFYAYGNRLALLTFSEDNINIFVIHSKEHAVSFRALFDLAWENSTVEPS